MLGLLLVLIERAAGLVLPASTRYLVDQVIVTRQTRLLAPLIVGCSWQCWCRPPARWQ